ncbi:hypothetical protein BSKO_09849 [Bryopsis sp. KO-2023]|nr:hypothetical protein BSKO_09849 [Bryopsis sp. KO-2023]
MGVMLLVGIFGGFLGVHGQYGDGSATPSAAIPVSDLDCCYEPQDFWPFFNCRKNCAPGTCERESNVYATKEDCCAPGGAFADGCRESSDCYVVDSYLKKTCKIDNEKCSRGWGVWPTMEECCAPGEAFSNGCTDYKEGDPCWIVDTFYPSKLCRETTECSRGLGLFAWKTKEKCCAPGAAFPAGCTNVESSSCYMASDFFPEKDCVLVEDASKCSRGWGTYSGKEECCRGEFQDECEESDDD